MNKHTFGNQAFYATRAIALIAATLSTTSVRGQTPVANTTHGADTYQTLYLTNLTQANDANQLAGDLRNMLPESKLIYVESQSAISFRGSEEDLALARKILTDLDKTKKIYRLLYTMTDKEDGKTIGVQHFSMIVASGTTSTLKQGSRIPVDVGGKGANLGSSEVTYLDIGQEIDASLDGYLDGVRLRSKVVQSAIAMDKSGAGTNPPVIRQATLEGTATLVQGKPLTLGSLDVPGSNRHQEVEVVSELVR